MYLEKKILKNVKFWELRNTNMAEIAINMSIIESIKQNVKKTFVTNKSYLSKYSDKMLS